MMYKPENKTELQTLVNDENINLKDIDTSLITDMSELFKHSKRKDFSVIETCNASNVKDMNFMFANCFNFNQPFNKWNTSNTESMNYMFDVVSLFNRDLNNWNVDKVKYMFFLFHNADSFEYENIINFSFKMVKDFNKIFNIIPLEILLKI